MDPVSSMPLTANRLLRKDIRNTNCNHKQGKLITVEEGIDCREANSRFFCLVNHESRLNIIITKNSNFISCKLGGQHEIVVDRRQYNQTHETWAIGDRPYQKLSSVAWNCHVRESELLLSTSNNNSSIVYELTRLNELNSIVKLKSIHLQHEVTYFNLNNAKEKVPVDGHTLVVQCNGNTNRIQVQNTKLLCHCNKRSSILPQSLIGDIPFELMQHGVCISPGSGNQCVASNNNNNKNINQNSINQDDLIVCDSIFSLESNSPMDFLRVKLQYNDRILLFETRSTASNNWSASTNHNNSQNNNNVSSSTNKNSTNTAIIQSNINNSTVQSSNDLNSQTQQAPSSSSSSSSTMDWACQADGSADWSTNNVANPQNWLTSLIDSSTSSGSNCQQSNSINNNQQQQQPTSTDGANNSNNNQISNNIGLKTPAARASQNPTTCILRARVRVTNFGVCVMPVMMTNYACTYRFVW